MKTRPQVDARLIGVVGLPEVRPGDDLAGMISSVVALADGDVLVVAQKIVSKAEGRLVQVDHVRSSERARSLASETDKDDRLVQLILDESSEVVRASRGVLIVQDNRGWVCANAGVDRSNIEQTGGSETVALLPVDPDQSADRIRRRVRELAGVTIGVIVSDSHGRPWREGTVGVALGASGVTALADRRGQNDRHGYVLQHTLVGLADELAAAASLLMGQGDESIPAVVIRGIRAAGQGQARDLQRPRERDLFR